MRLDAPRETARMARLFETEALGEARWVSVVTGADEPATRALAAMALERAARNLRGRK